MECDRLQGLIWRIVLGAALLGWLVLIGPGPGPSAPRASDLPQEPSGYAPSPAPRDGQPASSDSAHPEADCREMLQALQRERSQVSRELAQVKRELAALRQELAEPGMKEIFAGIGYILGLAGVGFYVHCRKTTKKTIV